VLSSLKMHNTLFPIFCEIAILQETVKLGNVGREQYCG
jgi:hypothetical protein